MKLLEEWNDQLRGVHVVGLHRDQHGSDHDAGGDLQSELGAAGETEVATMRHLGVVVGETDGGVSARGEHRQPNETVAEVSPEQGGNNDRDHDQQAAHGRRACFFLVSFGSFFANELTDLEIAEPSNDERAYDERGEQRSKAGEGGAKSDVPKNAERCNVVLQFQE